MALYQPILDPPRKPPRRPWLRFHRFLAITCFLACVMLTQGRGTSPPWAPKVMITHPLVADEGER